MTTVVISQPMLFPWSGFFELVACADVFVHLDDAQFSKGSFTNRVQIKHQSGIKWMTIPLKGKGQFQQINQLEAAAELDWKQRHRELVRQSLLHSKNLQGALQLFDRVYSEKSLLNLLINSVELSSSLINASCPSAWLRSSEMKIAGNSSQRVLAIVKALGGTRYVTAHGASDYLEHEKFEQQGVRVEYVQYSKTEYPQLNGGFVPYVSILDAIANFGDRSAELIRPKTIVWTEFLQNKR
jgi:hypothetical protein